MKKNSEIYLTNHQYTLILIGNIIGIGMLSLPNSVVKIAKQDGWISAAIGGIYVIYMVLIGSYMCKKHPDNNILDLSKIYFGNFLGTILNLIFTSYFIYLLTGLSSGISNVLIMYITPFLTTKKILITILLVPAFISYKGIKTLGKMNEVIFYLTFIFFLVPMVALKDGNILNIMPVFSSGFKNIIKASKESLFSYFGIEILFLIYPFLKDKKKVTSSGIKASIVAIIIYTWITFITIYYIGINIIPKFLWPVVTVSESIMVPGINSFRYISMSLWTLMIFKTISIDYFSIAYCLGEIWRKINMKTWIYILYPVLFYISGIYGTPTNRRDIIIKLGKMYAIFNLVYVTSIAILIMLKRGEKNVTENKKS